MGEMKEPTTKEKWELKEFFDMGCPDCGCKEFLEGPCGGLSINIQCNDCGSWFNDMWVFGVERIPDKDGLDYRGIKKPRKDHRLTEADGQMVIEAGD